MTWTGTELAMPVAQQISIFEELGKQLARLHNLTDRWQRPAEFVRHAWDLNGLVGESPFWGRFWDNHIVDGEQQRLLQRMRDVGEAGLKAYTAADGDYGLIVPE